MIAFAKMSGSPKHKLHPETGEELTETADEREVYLRDGRKLVVSEAGSDQLVEIRSGAGLVEIRIQLTEQGPVVHVEAARLQLKASESVEIAAPHVAIAGSEKLELTGGKVGVHAEDDLNVESKEEIRINGKMIWLN